MKTKSKTSKAHKPSLKVKDLHARRNPRGGRKAGKDQQEFLKITLGP